MCRSERWWTKHWGQLLGTRCSREYAGIHGGIDGGIHGGMHGYAGGMNVHMRMAYIEQLDAEQDRRAMERRVYDREEAARDNV